MPKRAPRDYEAMSREIEAGEHVAFGPVELGPAHLRMGRPANGKGKAGNTPALPVRLPDQIRTELNERVKLGESGSASELVRLAVIEYFENHPRTA